MPAVSKAQLRWVNSPSGHKVLGEEGVKEWDAATKGKKLPEKKALGGEIKPLEAHPPETHPYHPYRVHREEADRFIVSHVDTPHVAFPVAKFGLSHKTLAKMRSALKPPEPPKVPHLAKGGPVDDPSGTMRERDASHDDSAFGSGGSEADRQYAMTGQTPEQRAMMVGLTPSEIVGARAGGITTGTIGDPNRQTDPNALGGPAPGSVSPTQDSANPDRPKTYATIQDAEQDVGGRALGIPTPETIADQPLGPDQAPPEKKPDDGLPKIPGYSGFKELSAAQRKYDEGSTALARATDQLGKDQAATRDWEIAQRAAIEEKRDRDSAQIEGQVKQTIEDIKNFKIDPDRAYSSLSSKLGAGLGMILSGIGSGYNGGPNLALQVINKRIDADIEAQKMELGKKKTVLDEYHRQYGNIQDAANRRKLDLQADVVARLDKAMATAKGPQELARAQMAQAEMATNMVKTKNELVNSMSGRALQAMQMQKMGMEIQQSKQMMQLLNDISTHTTGGGGLDDNTVQKMDMLTGGKFAENYARNPFDPQQRLYRTTPKGKEAIDKVVTEEQPYVKDLQSLHQKIREISSLQANNPLSSQRREVLGKEVQAIMGAPRFTEMVNRFTGNEEKLARSLFNDWNVPGMRAGVLRNIEGLIGTSTERQKAVLRQHMLGRNIPGVNDEESTNPTALHTSRAGEH